SGQCGATVFIVNPTATDNCSATFTFAGVRSDSKSLTDLYPVGTTKIVWTATDASGNTSLSCEQIVTIADAEKPVKPVLADVIAQCSATLPVPSTTDNCKGTITGTTADPLTYTAQGNYTITWSFDDGNGNIESAIQNVIIKDTEKPVKPVLADVVAQCSATVPVPSTTDNCKGTITGTTADPLTYTTQGNYTITWSFDDGNGNIESAIQNVIIKDTEKPVISCPATISQVADANKCGATVSIVNPTATDNCSTTFTFAGVRSDSKSLTDLYPVGTTKIVWTATDASGNISASCEQTITIADAEKPVKPILADVIAQCSATVPVPSTTDNCKGTIIGTTADPLTYTAQGAYTITWSFDDGNGNIESAIQNVIIKDTEKPVISCPATISQVADANKCGATVSIVNPTATDNCSTTFTFAGVRSDSKSLTELYPVGTTKIVWTATDASGNISASCEQTITIADAEKPVKPILADVIAQCSATVPVPSTIDNCKGTIIGTTADPLTYTAQGAYTITWSFDDGNGNIESAIQNVIIKDTEKPVITCPATISQVADANKCGATVSIVNPTATDNCSTTFTFAGVRSDSKSLTDLYPVGTTKIVWTATDASGNASLSCEQTITIADAEKPVKPVLADVVAQCSATVPVPSTTDNCKGTITGTTADPLTYTAQGNYTITWSFDDGNGNIESAIQNVIIKDTEKPVISCPATISQVADANKCGATVSIVNPTATDNCSTTFTFAGVRSDSKSLTDLYPVGTTKIVWTATDASGNISASCEQTITIADTEKPVITCPAAINKNADANKCGATVSIVNPTATDNCSTTFTFTGVRSDSKLLTDLYPVGTTKIVWTATDASGNISASCEQTITITDTEKPVISCPAAINQIADSGQCGATVSIVNPTATDNCSTTFIFTGVRSDSKSLTDLYPVGTTTITWTATDASGNTSLSCEQTITITDTEKPVISCPAAVIANTDIGSCTATIVLSLPTVTDNCGIASVANDAPVVFPIGITTVTWTVTDNNGNISTCTQTVTVYGPIKSNDDLGVSINSYVGGIAVSNVLNNDLLNCVSVISNQVKITLASTLPSGVNFDTTTGEVSVNPHTPSGTYTFDYTICDLSNITNCSTSTVKITIDNPIIEAITETTSPINGNTGGKTPPLTSNDKLNGVDVVIGTNPGEVKLTPVTVPTGLTLNPDGTVTVSPNTPAGNYDVTYKICEVTNPTNCAEVTSVIVVGAAIIDAADDNVLFADGINGTLEAINVLENDKLNGSRINNPAVVTIKSLTVLSGITLNEDGTIDVAPNTPGGTYTLNYQICDVINKTNCVSAKVTIFVAVPSIAVIKTATFNDENKSGYANAGETITYTFKITNTGNTPLTNVTVSDPLPGLVMTGSAITLGVNETDEHTFIGVYVIKQSDINAGKISNQATAFGTSA
ncbi:HYR domain-containing protein, partial [Flavobacterium sp. PL02]|uniref:HYR domain-containing protein n=1 Tax=Flavobacterium sp. PL02 TaxID=3088354 RepID=UPI002B227EEE